MKRYVNSDAILCMSNIRGVRVRNPRRLNFSFYFSSGEGVSHSIRVKPMFNPDKLRASLTGTLKLCDDWEYIPGQNDRSVSERDVDEMKNFFRNYIVLFCAVWDGKLDDGALADWLEGEITWNSLLREFEFYWMYSTEMDTIHSVRELESFCRTLGLVNFYGN